MGHPTTGHATVASLRAAGGFLPLEVPHVAYADRKFDSPSGKIEFYSSRADKFGLPLLAAQSRTRFPLSVGAELRTNTDALSFLLRRGTSPAIAGKTQLCAPALDIQGRGCVLLGRACRHAVQPFGQLPRDWPRSVGVLPQGPRPHRALPTRRHRQRQHAQSLRSGARLTSGGSRSRARVRTAPKMVSPTGRPTARSSRPAVGDGRIEARTRPGSIQPRTLPPTWRRCATTIPNSSALELQRLAILGGRAPPNGYVFQIDA